jgi:hypothetical protein
MALFRTTFVPQGVSTNDMLSERLHAHAEPNGRVFVPIHADKEALDLFPSEASPRPILAAAARDDLAGEARLDRLAYDSNELTRQRAPVLGRLGISMIVVMIALAVGVAGGLAVGRQPPAALPALEAQAPIVSSGPVSAPASRPLQAAPPALQAATAKIENAGLEAAPPVIVPKTPVIASKTRSDRSTDRGPQPGDSRSRTTVAFAAMRDAAPTIEVPPPQPPQTSKTAIPEPAPPAAAAVTVAVLASPPMPAPAAAPSAVRPAPPPAAVAAPRADRVDEEAGIRAALGKYRDAYEQLDAAAAKRVWSSVDERALSKAFANLESQSVTFDDCRTSVNAASAEASCRGTVTYIGRLGSRNSQTQKRQWTFKLHKEGDAWAVQNVQVR